MHLISLSFLAGALAPLAAADPSIDCIGSALGTHSVTLAEASSSIDSFCGNQAFWNLTIVSPVSMGLYHEDRSYAVVNNVLVNNGADNVWFKVTFEEGPCVGSFKFTYGSDDAAKKKNCINNFMPILDKV